MSKQLLQVAGLCAHYGSKTVLQGIDFSVSRGQIIGLLGPNGSGKSTAIASLLGLVHAGCKSLQWLGSEISLGSKVLRSQSGVLLQAGSTDPKLSAKQNLSLSARLYGLSRNASHQSAEEWLRYFDLSDRSNDRMHTFSGGMKRKVELAKAMLHKPAILMLDEPTTGFDELAYQKAWDEIQRQKEARGLGVLLTTHKPDEAENCDRILLIDNGKLIADGSPEELKAQLPGDIIRLQCNDPKQLAQHIKERFGFESITLDDQVQITQPEGHRLIPKLIEGLSAGAVSAITMHRPSLADVFVQHTGRHFFERQPS